MTGRDQRVGEYELVRRLGEGGMAETFAAVRCGPAGFEQRVCIKRILPSRASDATFVELFLDEARLLGRLACNGIVRVYECFVFEGVYYMALELIDGGDLGQLMAALDAHGLRVPDELALYIVAEVLAALDYAHKLEHEGEWMGIVHRDISPSNILISSHGDVKLTDFGIAKARGRHHRTRTGETKGKIAYMSPEQIRADGLDGRSDLFSLGVVLFELLTGLHPFDGNTDLAVQIRIVSGQCADLHALRPDLPHVVRRLVDAMLKTSAGERLASAERALSMMSALVQPSAYVQKQRLAELVADPSAHGAPRCSRKQAPVDTTSALLGVRLAVGGLLSATPPAEGAVAARQHEPAERPPMRALRWTPLIVVPLLATYVLAARAAGWPLPWDGAATPPILPTLTAEEGVKLPGAPTPALPSGRMPPAEPGGARPATPRIERVISPPKGDTRSSAQPVEAVVSPIKAVPVPVSEPLETVISPSKGAVRHGSEPAERVASPSAPRQGATPQSLEQVISPPKGAARGARD